MLSLHVFSFTTGSPFYRYDSLKMRNWLYGLLTIPRFSHLSSSILLPLTGRSFKLGRHLVSFTYLSLNLSHSSILCMSFALFYLTVRMIVASLSSHCLIACLYPRVTYLLEGQRAILCIFPNVNDRIILDLNNHTSHNHQLTRTFKTHSKYIPLGCDWK